ncbi:MAG: glycosyltransferase family 2 protein [Candidatus Omnitrophica bacterium]|nr:glycosyltransferase family 2 protein [Candidatus Omnitrophota bacterium]
MDGLKFSILLPAYNGQEFIAETLKSIFAQGFTNYEIVIVDDNSSDNTVKIINSLGDSRIKLYKNEVNLGYPANLRECYKRATGDIIYLMGQDDILGKNALVDTYNAFKSSEDIGAVTRPYYWFDKDINKPVRAKKQLNPEGDEVVRITGPYEKIIRVLQTLDQLTGFALRKKNVDLDFHQHIFPCHAYPILPFCINI